VLCSDVGAFNPQRLRIAMMRRGRSAHSVATAMGVRVPMVMRWQRGKATPDQSAVQRLAETLDFPPEFFSGPDLVIPQRMSHVTS